MFLSAQQAASQARCTVPCPGERNTSQEPSSLKRWFCVTLSGTEFLTVTHFKVE